MSILSVAASWASSNYLVRFFTSTFNFFTSPVNYAIFPLSFAFSATSSSVAPGKPEDSFSFCSFRCIISVSFTSSTILNSYISLVKLYWASSSLYTWDTVPTFPSMHPFSTSIVKLIFWLTVRGVPLVKITPKWLNTLFNR